MAFFLPVDLFGNYVDGYELGRKAINEDRINDENVIAKRIQNTHDLSTLDGRIADTSNKYFDNYLGYQVNEASQPGKLDMAQLGNIIAQDNLLFGSNPTNRQNNLRFLEAQQRAQLAAVNATARASNLAGYPAAVTTGAGTGTGTGAGTTRVAGGLALDGWGIPKTAEQVVQGSPRNNNTSIVGTPATQPPQGAGTFLGGAGSQLYGRPQGVVETSPVVQEPLFTGAVPPTVQSIPLQQAQAPAPQYDMATLNNIVNQIQLGIDAGHDPLTLIQGLPAEIVVAMAQSGSLPDGVYQLNDGSTLTIQGGAIL